MFRHLFIAALLLFFLTEGYATDICNKYNKTRTAEQTISCTLQATLPACETNNDKVTRGICATFNSNMLELMSALQDNQIIQADAMREFEYSKSVALAALERRKEKIKEQLRPQAPSGDGYYASGAAGLDAPERAKQTANRDGYDASNDLAGLNAPELAKIAEEKRKKEAGLLGEIKDQLTPTPEPKTSQPYQVDPSRQPVKIPASESSADSQMLDVIFKKGIGAIGSIFILLLISSLIKSIKKRKKSSSISANKEN